MPQFTVVAGPDRGKVYDVGPGMVIGRDSHCPVRLSDPEVSRQHCQLTPGPDDSLSLVDLGSVNGTTVNGTRITRTGLTDGDTVVVGATTMRFTADGAGRVTFVDDEPAGDRTAIVLRADARGSVQNLDVLLEAIRAAGSILDLSLLLDRILEILLRAIPADRAFILLRDQPDAPLGTAAFRGRGDVAVSRGIINHVATRHEAVVLADVRTDERFASGQSVIGAGIRGAICVPLLGRHSDVGVLYCDTLTGAARLTSDRHLALAVAVGHQIAFAVEETRYHESLLRTERLAAVGQAVAIMAHHVRNILQGLQSGSELLRLGIEQGEPESLRAGFNLVTRNQSRLLDLVNEMLTYSADRPPRKTPVDIGEVVNEVVELIRPRAAERGVQLSFRAEGKPVANVDRECVHRAALNLVTNAIEAAEESAAPEVRVFVEATDGAVLIRVVDNGPGIAPELIGRVFMPFVSGKGGRGTGLGLAVCRKIAREHGGDIAVRSEPGKGATFELTLPVGAPQNR